LYLWREFTNNLLEIYQYMNGSILSYTDIPCLTISYGI
uniref:Uncharacterized protein n=1 Tax=Amphimedon queenslandica TaxID=400682 RepID=A0A1X7THN2_AMPQE